MYIYPLPQDQQKYTAEFVKGEVEIYLALDLTEKTYTPVVIPAYVHGHYSIHLRVVRVGKGYELLDSIWDVSYKQQSLIHPYIEPTKKAATAFATLCATIYPNPDKNSYLRDFAIRYWGLESKYAYKWCTPMDHEGKIVRENSR